MADETNGTAVVDTTTTTVDSTPVAGSEASPISISDDQFVKLPGQEKPVKYGDFYRGLQSNQTRLGTEKADLQRQLQAVKDQAQRSQNKTGEAATPSQRQRMIAELKGKTFLSGEEAANAVDSILGEFESNLGVRDNAIRLLAQKLLQNEAVLNELNGERSNGSFQTKVGSALKSNGLSDEFADFAQMIYLSHEGDGLDEEYPGLVKKFFDKFAASVRKMDQEKVTRAKQNRFPGRGGQGSASKPEDISRLSPRETADKLWDQFGLGEGT